MPFQRGYVAVLVVPSISSLITLLFERAVALDGLYHML
jgi:hypothetical protein